MRIAECGLPSVSPLLFPLCFPVFLSVFTSMINLFPSDPINSTSYGTGDIIVTTQGVGILGLQNTDDAQKGLSDRYASQQPILK